MEDRIISTKTVTTSLGLNTNLVACMILHTSEPNDIKECISWNPETNEGVYEYYGRTEHRIDLGIYWTDGTENFGYRCGPYTSCIRNLYEFESPCWDLYKDWENKVTDEFIMSLWRLEDKLYRETLTREWWRTIEAFSKLLFSEKTKEDQKEVTQLPLQDLREDLISITYDGIDRESETTTDKGDAEKRVMMNKLETALAQVLPFELDTTRSIVKDPHVRVSFDYRPMGFLSGLAGIEFPVWNSNFKLREGKISIMKKGEEEILWEGPWLVTDKEKSK